MATTSRDPQAVRMKISQAVRVGDAKKALSLAAKLIKLPRASVQDCLEISELGRRFVDLDLSILALRMAHKKSPLDVELLISLAAAEFRAGYSKQAFNWLKKTDELCRTADGYDELAVQYGKLGAPDLAHNALLKAREVAPGNLHVLFNLAVSYGFQGEIDEAERLYDFIISRGHKTGYTYQNRSWLRKQTSEQNHVPELEQVLKGLPPQHQDVPLILYALGKELEDLGRGAEAIDYYEKGAAGRRNQFNFSIEAAIKEIEDIISSFDESFFAEQAQGYLSDEPIFIVGMPRTGSTLLEQIVGSHSMVSATGELANFFNVLNRLAIRSARAAGVRQPNLVSFYKAVDPKELGKSYIASTRPRTGHTERFTDKLPNNYLSCGLIARALPNAKIVHVHRNPMDSCFAMFKQAFHDGFEFTYDQKEVAQMYVAYRKVMDYWDAVLPSHIIHVQYEELVTEPERVIRDLLGRLELEWEDGCLDHTKYPRAAMTASAAQVRQPLHTSSVGKWREFADRLSVMRETLEAGGVSVE